MITPTNGSSSVQSNHSSMSTVSHCMQDPTFLTKAYSYCQTLFNSHLEKLTAGQTQLNLRCEEWKKDHAAELKEMQSQINLQQQLTHDLSNQIQGKQSEIVDCEREFHASTQQRDTLRTTIISLIDNNQMSDLDDQEEALPLTLEQLIPILQKIRALAATRKALQESLEELEAKKRSVEALYNSLSQQFAHLKKATYEGLNEVKELSRRIDALTNEEEIFKNLEKNGLLSTTHSSTHSSPVDNRSNFPQVTAKKHSPSITNSFTQASFNNQINLIPNPLNSPSPSVNSHVNITESASLKKISSDNSNSSSAYPLTLLQKIRSSKHPIKRTPPHPDVSKPLFRDSLLHQMGVHSSMTVSDLSQILAEVPTVDELNRSLGGWTPLLLVCYAGRIDLLNELLYHKVSLDDTIDGWNCLQLLAWSEKTNKFEKDLLIKVFEQLLKKKGSLLLTESPSPAHIAAFYGFHKTLNALILVVENNSDKTAIDLLCRYDRSGFAPIHYAAISNKPYAANSFLRALTTMNGLQTKHESMTALMIAANNVSPEMLSGLLQYSKESHLNQKDKNGRTVLDHLKEAPEGDNKTLCLQLLESRIQSFNNNNNTRN